MLSPCTTPVYVQGRWVIAAASDQPGGIVPDLSTLSLEITVLWVGVCSPQQIIMAGSWPEFLCKCPSPLPAVAQEIQLL